MNTHLVVVEVKGRSSMHYVADEKSAKSFAAFYRPKIGKGEILAVKLSKLPK